MHKTIKRIWITGFACLVLACPGWADVKRPDTLIDTLNILLDALTSDARVTSPYIDFADRSIKYRYDDSDGISYPDNLHKLLQASETDQERKNILDGFIHGLDDLPKTLVDKDNIIPVIRTMRYGQSSGENSPVFTDLAGDLAIFLVQDLPTSLSYLYQSDIDALGMDFEAALELALSNMVKRQWQPRVEGDGVYMLILDGNFEASLLLDTKLWDRIEAELGAVLVSVPARDLVMFGALSQADVRARLTELSRKFVKTSSYPLSSQLMIRDQGRWVAEK